MKPIRVVAVAAVLAAFTVGLNVGVFLGDEKSVSPPIDPRAARPNDHFTPGATSPGPRRIIDRPSVAAQNSEDPAGDALVQQAWTALTMPDDNERHAAWLGVIRSYAGHDARAIRELLRKRKAEGLTHDFEWSTFWPRWGEVDGPAAMAHVQSEEAAEAQPEAAALAMQGWAKTDPAAARVWLEANASSPLFDAALKGYVRGLAQSDLARATHDALGIGKGRPLTDVAGVLVEQALRQRQLGGMLDWWRSLPDDPNSGSLRESAIGPILRRLATADPKHAQAWLAELATSGYRSDALIGDFAGDLSAKDPAAAVAWVASLPPSTADGHYSGIGRSVRAWMEKDPAGLDRWLATLPPSPLRDQAVEAKKPTKTLTFTTTITDGAKSNVFIESFNGMNSGAVKASPQKAGADAAIGFLLETRK
jgi:hypothetical protein